MSRAPAKSLMERAAAALMRLAGERPWREIGVRAIAEAAGVKPAALYAAAPSALAVLAWQSARFDEAALATDEAGANGADPHDRLFDATMARIEAMEPHRTALLAIIAGESPLALAPQAPRTARAILEGAGLAATPVRIAAMTALWLRILQVWRDDEGALNRTMAEIDRRLRQYASLMRRVGQGF